MKFKNYTTDTAKNFSVIAYAESMPNNIQAIVSALPCVKYAYIYHDKDILESGELKKPHYHIYLSFDKKVRYTTIAKSFGVVANSELIQPVRYVPTTIRYFVHFDDLDKYQYNLSDLITFNIDRDFIFNLESNEQKETSAVLDLFEYIKLYTPTLSMLFKYACDNGLYGYYRKNYSIIKDLLCEVKNNYERQENYKV